MLRLLRPRTARGGARAHTGGAARDSVADLLYKIAQATHEEDDAKDKGEDDVGEAMDDDDDDKDDLHSGSSPRRRR